MTSCHMTTQWAVLFTAYTVQQFVSAMGSLKAEQVTEGSHFICHYHQEVHKLIHEITEITYNKYLPFIPFLKKIGCQVQLCDSLLPSSGIHLTQGQQLAAV